MTTTSSQRGRIESEARIVAKLETVDEKIQNMSVMIEQRFTALETREKSDLERKQRIEKLLERHDERLDNHDAMLARHRVLIGVGSGIVTILAGYAASLLF